MTGPTIEQAFGCLGCGSPLIKYAGPLWVCVMCERQHDKPHVEDPVAKAAKEQRRYEELLASMMVRHGLSPPPEPPPTLFQRLMRFLG